MAKIKLLKENELIGGTDNTQVLPVTSTKAVYNSDNVKLDDILKDLEYIQSSVYNLGDFGSINNVKEILGKKEIVSDPTKQILVAHILNSKNAGSNAIIINQVDLPRDKTVQIAYYLGSTYHRTIVNINSSNPTTNDWLTCDPHGINLVRTKEGINLTLKNWSNKSIGDTITIPLVSNTQAGLISASDKLKIDKTSSYIENLTRLTVDDLDEILGGVDVDLAGGTFVKTVTLTLEKFNALDPKDNNTYYYII